MITLYWLGGDSRAGDTLEQLGGKAEAGQCAGSNGGGAGYFAKLSKNARLVTKRWWNVTNLADNTGRCNQCVFQNSSRSIALTGLVNKSNIAEYKQNTQTGYSCALFSGCLGSRL